MPGLDIDKSQEISSLPDQAAAQNPPSTPPIQPNGAEKEFVSKGWKIHNEATYRGIDWLLNSTIGVIFSYWQARTHSGKKYFGEPVSKGFEFVLKPFMKGDTLKEGAKWGTNFAGIMAGGFAIIPPMMAMENKKNKKRIVRWLDEKIYGKDVVDRDPRFAESYCRIDEEPHKNFVTGMVSRFIAIAPILVAVSIPASNTYLNRFIYEPISKGSKWVTGKLRIKAPSKMLLEGDLEHIDCDSRKPKAWMSNWNKLHQLVGFDFGLTIFYAILHEISYKTLAAMGMKNGGHPSAQDLENEAKCLAKIPAHMAAPEADSAKYRNLVKPRDKDIPEQKTLFTQKVVSEAEPSVQPSL